MLKGLDVDDAALGLLGGGDGAHLQHFGVLLQELVGGVGDGGLGGGGLAAVLHAQSQHHLALPQGDGVDQGGLDLLNHQRVVILQHPGLGAHLDGHHPRQLQIVELLLKPVAHLHHVVIRLGVLLLAAGLRRPAHLLQLAGLHRRQLLLAGDDVHGQLLVVLQVQLVHLVKHGDVLHEHHLMLLQLPGNLFHVGLGLAVLGLHGLHPVARLLEKAEQALLLFLLAEALELHHQAGQGVPHLPQILGAHVGQGAFGEGGDPLLGGHAVLQDHLGVVEVDLLGEVVHHLLLRLGEHTVVDHHRLGLGILRLQGDRRGLRLTAQGEGGRLHLGRVGVQGQLGHHHAVQISHCRFLRLFPGFWRPSALCRPSASPAPTTRTTAYW